MSTVKLGQDMFPDAYTEKMVLSELLRNTTRLQDILQPGASSLENPHAELQSHLHAIQALVETLPRSIGSDIEDEWSLVKKGLKQPAKILPGHR